MREWARIRNIGEMEDRFEEITQIAKWWDKEMKNIRMVK